MFWNVLDKPRQSLLKRLTKNPPMEGAYLAGGTALALMFGHRLSEDFDWFLPGSFDPGKLLPLLEGFGEVAVAETHTGTFHGWIDGMRVSWLHYPNPLLEELTEAEDLPGLFCSSPIGPDKWVALPTGAPARTLSICMNWAARGRLEELFVRQKFPGRAESLPHDQEPELFRRRREGPMARHAEGDRLERD